MARGPDLKPRERPRYINSAGLSQEEVARELGCSRQNVHQLEMRALRKLRIALTAQGLTLDDFLDAPRDEFTYPDWGVFR